MMVAPELLMNAYSQGLYSSLKKDRAGALRGAGWDFAASNRDAAPRLPARIPSFRKLPFLGCSRPDCFRQVSLAVPAEGGGSEAVGHWLSTAPRKSRPMPGSTGELKLMARMKKPTEGLRLRVQRRLVDQALAQKRGGHRTKGLGSSSLEPQAWRRKSPRVMATRRRLL